MNGNIKKYESIINLPYPVSKKHPQMSMLDRAAQFSSFAALTGHADAIRETARLTALFSLAEFLENGKMVECGIEVNLDEAVRLYREYARQGLELAKKSLKRLGLSWD